MAGKVGNPYHDAKGLFTTGSGGSKKATNVKSRLSRKELNELFDAKHRVASLREAADRGDENASKVVRDARDIVARLTAKRDNKIWL